MAKLGNMPLICGHAFSRGQRGIWHMPFCPCCYIIHNPDPHHPPAPSPPLGFSSYTGGRNEARQYVGLRQGVLRYKLEGREIPLACTAGVIKPGLGPGGPFLSMPTYMWTAHHRKPREVQCHKRSFHFVRLLAQVTLQHLVSRQAQSGIPCRGWDSTQALVDRRIGGWVHRSCCVGAGGG